MSSSGEETKWGRQLRNSVEEERVFLLLENSPTWVGTFTVQLFATKLSIGKCSPSLYYSSSGEHTANFVSHGLVTQKLCNEKKHGDFVPEKNGPHIRPFFCACFTSRDTRQRFGMIYVHSLLEARIAFSAPVSTWPEFLFCWCFMGCCLQKSDWLPGAGVMQPVQLWVSPVPWCGRQACIF